MPARAKCMASVRSATAIQLPTDVRLEGLDAHRDRCPGWPRQGRPEAEVEEKGAEPGEGLVTEAGQRPGGLVEGHRPDIIADGIGLDGGDGAVTNTSSDTRHLGPRIV